MKKQIKKIVGFTAALALVFAFHSCDDLEKYELPEAGSIADATPPEADFSFTQGAGPDEEWKDYTFANLSTSATTYSWDYGDGNTSTDVDGANTYPGEGTYTVTLTASDALGVVSESTQIVEVVEPPTPAVPDPVIINGDFDKLAKLGSSNLCSCSGWDNDDIGEQGESSSGNGGSDNVVKFDNNEPDHVYQEFAVTPNADYSITIVTSHKTIASTPGTYPGSTLEIRILAGAGYNAGYTPTYYTAAPDFPNSGYGYTTVAQVETAANNLLVETIPNPNDDDYFTQTYTFNAGANDSVALFIRGIGGDSSVGSYGYSSGDEEIRADSVTITAVN
ncbi:PKD domain-containing protein [Kordia sp. YSTF-M3]|uniref:PKD domain-containing protein n=1 Tax=Kordia aestuariivivens TaxID=2759037 RepID=A0ABR7Q4F2_9FLAO|nr:PKD domain-containing protein [Kordia aestuariivivens]MBC8753388.1 PKD domain-containing protein [Kordia aestuariivivens]